MTNFVKKIWEKICKIKIKPLPLHSHLETMLGNRKRNPEEGWVSG
jgi:hypothetical protein